VADWNSDPFEELYASVGDDLEQVPWARLGPYPGLVAWLDRRTVAPRARALVIACGLGNDAEELSERGYAVTAFDLSATAIGWCRRRFPASSVDYQVADLLKLPREWAHRYDVVVEINTIQSLPLSLRGEVIATIAGTVAPGGVVFVRCSARAPGEPAGSRPWPVSRAELAGFETAGLRETEFAEDHPEPPRSPSFQAVYELIF
jgi:2-polyprenyl-3-methyl-5-hydroxy-6-metoxy-1,4-benzoquinol methylase